MIRQSLSAAQMRTSDDERAGGEELMRHVIDEAQTPPDVLSDLLEQVCSDPAAAFRTEVIPAMSGLRDEALHEFEKLRAQLKDAGVRVSVLDEALRKHKGLAEREPSQSDLLLRIAGDAELYHTSDRIALADTIKDGHRETWPVRSKSFRIWLVNEFYKLTGQAPNAEALQAAFNVIEAQALLDGSEHQVCLCVGEHGGKPSRSSATSQKTFRKHAPATRMKRGVCMES